METRQLKPEDLIMNVGDAPWRTTDDNGNEITVYFDNGTWRLDNKDGNKIMIPATGIITTPDKPEHWQSEKLRLDIEIDTLRRRAENAEHKYNNCMSNFVELNKQYEQIKKNQKTAIVALMIKMFASAFSTIISESNIKVGDMQMSEAKLGCLTSDIKSQVESTMALCERFHWSLMDTDTHPDIQWFNRWMGEVVVELVKILSTGQDLKEIVRGLPRDELTFDDLRTTLCNVGRPNAPERRTDTLAHDYAVMLVRMIGRNITDARVPRPSESTGETTESSNQGAGS
jgi:hypothetical protein